MLKLFREIYWTYQVCVCVRIYSVKSKTSFNFFLCFCFKKSLNIILSLYLLWAFCVWTYSSSKIHVITHTFMWKSESRRSMWKFYTCVKWGLICINPFNQFNMHLWRCVCGMWCGLYMCACILSVFHCVWPLNVLLNFLLVLLAKGFLVFSNFIRGKMKIRIIFKTMLVKLPNRWHFRNKLEFDLI